MRPDIRYNNPVETDDVKTPVFLRDAVPILLWPRLISIALALAVFTWSIVRARRDDPFNSIVVPGILFFTVIVYYVGKGLTEGKRLAVYALCVLCIISYAMAIYGFINMAIMDCLIALVIFMAIVDIPLIIGIFIHWKHFK
jgi:hypothetical protein